MTIRVIIVDDQAMVRAGFAALLSAQSDIDVVGEAADGRQGVEVSRHQHPDVVLMDVRMPEMDGLAAARELDAAHEARRRLAADLRGAPSSSALARELGLHTRKLDQAFKRAFGVSMARYLQEARLAHGRELILNGGLSVSEAAWHVGYAPAHFSVAFRRRFGVPPSALR
ncbi:hypothetical protein DDE05_26590 [Streptomyces cavourensis]|nr:hypothetical protein DDE05_26590 [Streptomyces cavourensis]